MRMWSGAVMPIRAWLPRTSVTWIVTPWSGRMISSPGFRVSTNMIEPPPCVPLATLVSKCMGTYLNVQDHFVIYLNVPDHFGTYRNDASTLLARKLADFHVFKPGSQRHGEYDRRSRVRSRRFAALGGARI